MLQFIHQRSQISERQDVYQLTLAFGAAPKRGIVVAPAVVEALAVAAGLRFGNPLILDDDA